MDTLPAETKISQVFAKSQYCYALNEETNDVYSWGMGENYVLGSRDDDNQFLPYKVHPKMYYDAKVRHIGCGNNHVVVLTSANADSNDVPVFDFNLPLPVAEEESEGEASAEVVRDEPMAAAVEESKEPLVKAVID